MTENTEKPVCQLCGEPMPENEEMFKFHGYSGPCPKPPLEKKAAASPETGWMLERGDPPEWLCVDGGLFGWTRDANKALRLARREDGDALGEIIEDAWRITEHQFG